MVNCFMLLFRVIIQDSKASWLFYSSDILSIIGLISVKISWDKLIKKRWLRGATLIVLLLSLVSVVGESQVEMTQALKDLNILQIQLIAVVFVNNCATKYLESVALVFLLTAVNQTLCHARSSDTRFNDTLIFLLPLAGFLYKKRSAFIRDVEGFNNNLANQRTKKQEVNLLVHLLPAHVRTDR